MKNSCVYLLFLILISTPCFSQELNSDIKQTVIHNGVGLGSVIAVVLSWERNKSILFAILHGLFSWLYVIYFAFTRDASERK
jgi:hypothetical protein